MIRKFLIHCLIFTVVMAAGLVLLNTAFNTLRPRMFDMQEAHIALLGNSHVETSVNDSILTGSRNFARSAELAEFMYAKLKLLHKYNSQLDTVYVCFDEMIPFYKSYVDDIYSPSYYDMLTVSDWINIFRLGGFEYGSTHFARPFAITKMYDYMFATRATEFNLRKTDNIGGYMYLRRDKLQENIRRVKKSGQQPSTQPVSMYFLDRMAEYCRENDIQLIFICPPQHPSRGDNQQIYRSLHMSRYSDIPLVDCIDVTLPDSCYGDISHLNHRGARLFSRFLEDSVIHRHPVVSRIYTNHLK